MENLNPNITDPPKVEDEKYWRDFTAETARQVFLKMTVDYGMENRKAHLAVAQAVALTEELKKL